LNGYFGVNQVQTLTYQTHLSSPDIVSIGRLVLVRHLQRTLTQAYDGSGVFRINAHADDYCYPNDLIRGDAFIPTTTGRVRIQFEKFGRQNYLMLKWRDGSEALQAAFAAADKSGWGVGRIIDFAVDDWFNESATPADWPIAEYVRQDGRHTNYPTVIRPGQRIQLYVFGGNRYHMTGGNWTVTARGTGSLQFRAFYRDRGESNQTITFVNGVASGPLVIETNECSTLFMSLTASNAALPLHDARVIEPGVWPVDLDSYGRGYEGKTFAAIYAENANDPTFYLTHPKHARNGRNFDYARQVDAMSTILSIGAGSYHGVVDPSDRSLPHQGIGHHNGGYGGTSAWEWLIDQCAISNQHFYLNASHEWTDATMIAFCEVFKERAPSWMKLFIANSCEPWNIFFSEYYAFVVCGSARNHPRALESITYNSGTGKATAIKRNHGYANGDTVQVYGSTDPAYNRTAVIEAVDANTFRYTPSSTPTISPAPYSNITWPGSFKVGGTKTFTVSSIEFRWANESSDFYAYTGFLVTTSVPVVEDGDVVTISNVDGVGVDGIYRVQRHGNLQPNQFIIAFQFQALHKPLLEPWTAFHTYSPVSGRSILGSVIAGNAAIDGVMMQTIDAVADWQGYRTRHICDLARTQFSRQFNRIVDIVEGFNASSYNRRVLDAYVATGNGRLPPVSEVALHSAPYATGDTQDQKGEYVGDVKPLNSLTFSDNVGTATTSESHGWSVGNQVTIQGTNSATTHGKFTIASTPTATTFTFNAPGIPDGAASGWRRGMYAVKNNAVGILILAAEKSGSNLILTAPGHPFTAGQQVGLDGWTSAAYENIFTITAVTSSTFTVVAPTTTVPPVMDIDGRAVAFVTVVLPRVGQVILDRLQDADYIANIDGLVDLSQEFGVTPGFYEVGTHTYVFENAKRYPQVGAIIKAGQRHQKTHDAIFAQAELAITHGVKRHTFYTFCFPWSYDGETFGALEYQDDTRSRRWTGLLAAKEEFGADRVEPGVATGFDMVPPQPMRLDEEPYYGTIAPNGILSVDETATLDDDGQDGEFVPPILTFPAGSTSPQPFLYYPASVGTKNIAATISPPLGEGPTAMAIILDGDGNPGNATLLKSDNFDRGNGPIGNGWIVNGEGSATIEGNKLISQSTESTKFTLISTIIYLDGVENSDGQVKIDFIPGPSDTTGVVGALFRSDGDIGSDAAAFGVTASGNSPTRIYIRRYTDGYSEVFYNEGSQSSFVYGQPYRLLAKCYGEGPSFDIQLIDLETDEIMFDATGIPYTGNAATIPGPGRIGVYTFGGRTPIELIEVSSLSFDDPDPVPVLTVTPPTATLGNGVNSLLITATLANSDAALSATVTPNVGSLSTNLPIPGVGFTWTKPTTGSGSVTITVTDVDDSLVDTCVISYTQNTVISGKLSGWLRT